MRSSHHVHAPPKQAPGGANGLGGQRRPCSACSCRCVARLVETRLLAFTLGRCEDLIGGLCPLHTMTGVCCTRTTNVCKPTKGTDWRAPRTITVEPHHLV